MWQTLFSKVGHNSISQLMCSATYYQSVIRRWHLSTSLNLGKAFEFLDQETMVEVLCLVAQLCLTLCDPLDYSPSGSSVHGDSPGKNTGEVCPLPGDLPNLGIKPRSPALQADSLLSEPPGKPMVAVMMYISRCCC